MAEKMMEFKSKRMSILERILLLASFATILELFYQPNIDQAKTEKVFPSFNILWERLLASEIFVFGFIGIGLLYLIEKRRRIGKVFFAPKIYSPLPGLIFLFIFVSCLTGFSSSGFITQVRVVLLPAVFYIVYINMDIAPYWEKYFFKIIVLGLIGLTAISLMDYFGLDYLSSVRGQLSIDRFGLRKSTMMTVLVFNVAAAKLIFSRFRFRWLFILFLSFFNFFFHIHLKSSVLAALISLFIMIYFKLKNSRFGVKRVLAISCSLIIIISIIYIKLPKPFKDIMARNIAWRYFKSDIYTTEEFDLNIITAAPTKKNISSSRFEIWKAHFNESLNGFGLAPHGFGYGGIFGVKVNEFGYIQGAHNLLFFFMLNSGIIAAILLLLLIIKYIYVNMIVLSKIKSGIYDQFTREDLIAMFSYSVAIIASSMFEGSIRNLHVAWTFWFCVAVLIKRWEILKTAVNTK